MLYRKAGSTSAMEPQYRCYFSAVVCLGVARRGAYSSIEMPNATPDHLAQCHTTLLPKCQQCAIAQHYGMCNLM